ncbi:MAG TPA: M20/M25/M40 family metallo-hydrolase [Anaerolineae bacterium]|nr:M20/M25/M40 family metallo-hydrolase [Anaerolineae bacterium]
MSNPDSIRDEAVRHLQALLRIDTTNPPGKELAVAEYLAGVLRAEGYQPIVLEAAPGRGNLLARCPGDGAAAPLLLYAHTDVVPAEPAKWTHPPFAGVVTDGNIWGRGALDMKGMVAMELMTMLLLKRNGDALHRDVIFAATADEEIDSDVGAGWLITQHPDLVRAEYGISEFGGYSMHIQGQRFYPVMTAEKGVCWMKIRARGRPGHGSVPQADNAVLELARAIERVAGRPLPLHITPTAAEFIRRIAATLDLSQGLGLRALLNPLTHPLVARRIPGDGIGDGLRASLHNTISPTQLTAGLKANVIPSEAEATLDGRLLPGFDQETFLAEVRPRLGRQIEIEIEHYSPPLEAPADTPLFHAIETSLHKYDPAGIVIPYMLSGATDAKLFSQLGTKCYGFSPLKLKPDEPFDRLIHAHDERVSIDALNFGVHALYETVRSFCQ